MLPRILIDEDEVGNPVDATLTTIFENPYEDDEDEDWDSDARSSPVDARFLEIGRASDR